MRYIEYNISPNKKLNYIRIIILSFFAFSISSILIHLGIANISYLNSKTTEKQILLDNLKDYIEKFSDKKEEINDTIRLNKSKWEPRIKLINSLIAKKTFPFLKRFDILENILPDEAYLKSIDIKYGKKNRIMIKVETNSFNTLLNVYKKLSQLNLNYGKETFKNGKYTSIMSVIIRDE